MKNAASTLILFLLVIAFAVFAFIKSSEAERRKLEAIAAQEKVAEMKEAAEQLRLIAQQAAAEAREAEARALEAVADCQASKQRVDD